MPFGRLPRKARNIGAQAIAISGVDSVAKVNGWVNTCVRYRPEVIDEWSPPDVTLDRRYGDCEDIAILKQAMLCQLGVPAWVLIVNDRMRARKVDGKWVPGHHAVAVTAEYVLDLRPNRPLSPRDLIDYIPILAFDTERTWLYGKAVV